MSEPQMPVATVSTTTSWGPGDGAASRSISRRRGAVVTTATLGLFTRPSSWFRWAQPYLPNYRAHRPADVRSGSRPVFAIWPDVASPSAGRPLRGAPGAEPEPDRKDRGMSNGEHV